MKALVVTFVRAYNYGAVLQCYALCRKLQDAGFDVQALDYYPKYFKDSYTLSRIGKVPFIPSLPIRTWLGKVRIKLLVSRRCAAFHGFIQKHIPLTTKQYTTVEEVDAHSFDYDIFISGSDQVWSDNCAQFDPIFFLKFNSAEKGLKASYAASFGKICLPAELEKEYYNRLENWHRYSVREDSGREILKQLLGIDAERCCDPTMLLTGSEWRELIPKASKTKPYILIYNVKGCPELIDYGKQLSAETGLPVYSLNSVLERETIIGVAEKRNGFVHYGCAGPKQWLEMFANASYVLTDSFHGTVFSMINHKKFMVVSGQTKERNYRAEELLGQMDLRERVYCGDLSTIYQDINWEAVDDVLRSIRDRSMKYIYSLGNE